MNGRLASHVGSAFFWQGTQLASVKIIFLARTLILARLLVPEDFGLLAVSLIAVDLLASLTNLGLIPALVQRQEIEEIHFNTAWTIGLIRGAGIALGVALAAPFLAQLFSEPEAVLLIRVAAFYPLLDALSSIKVADLVRKLEFRSLAVLKISEGLINTGVSVVLALRYGAWALLAGIFAGIATRFLASYLLAPHRPRLALNFRAAKTLVQFGRWILLVGVVSVAATAFLQAFISRRLGVADLGLYYLAAKLAFLPAEVGREVVGTVTFPLFAQLQSNLDRAARAFRSILTGVWALLMPASFLLITLAPTLVNDLLGEKWQGTVPLIRIMALASAIGLFGEIVVPVLQGTGRPQNQFALEVVQSSVLLASMVILIGRFEVAGAAGAWLFGVGAAQVLAYLFIRRILPGAFRGLMKPSGLIGLATLAAVLLASGLERLLPGLAGLLIGGLLGLGMAALLLLVGDRQYRLGLAQDLVQVVPTLKGLVG